MFYETVPGTALGAVVLAFPAFLWSPAPTSPEEIAYTLRFAASVGADAFACGRSYSVEGATIQPRDLRFYVSEVTLLRPDGSAVPLALEQDGLWQQEGVALLDFEDGAGECRNGTSDVRDLVVGTAPAGEVAGVRFTVGVPFELNHANQAIAASPLSLSAMFWSWNAGYKFVRAEVLTDGLPLGFFVHLGSTLCTPSGTPTRPATSCGNANRVTVEFPAFDLERDAVVFDLAALLAGSDLTGDGQAERGACMSSATDVRCNPVFAALGLRDGLSRPSEQQVFRRESAR